MAIINNVYIDDMMAKQIPRIRYDVLKRDRDKVLVVDGREGSGKSVLAQQLAKALDNNFNIEKIFFNHESFIAALKSPERKKGDCLILDEAFSSANSRASLSAINRAMIGVATEMRQLNLFVIIVLPSFFDLDRYFALWRCETLFHVYFNKKGQRGQYIIFPFNKKKYLYLKGKKNYSYGIVKSPYPPCSFRKDYSVDEKEYREKKEKAFRVRKMEDKALKFKTRMIKLIEELRHLPAPYRYTDRKIAQCLDISEDFVQKWRTGKE
jgi:hypothetical protein